MTDDEEFKKSLKDDFYVTSDSSLDGDDSKEDHDNNDDWSDTSDDLDDNEVDDATFDNWLAKEDNTTSLADEDTELVHMVHNLNEMQFSQMGTVATNDDTDNDTSSLTTKGNVLVSDNDRDKLISAPTETDTQIPMKTDTQTMTDDDEDYCFIVDDRRNPPDYVTSNYARYTYQQAAAYQDYKV